MTWIIRRARMFTCPYLRHEETMRTHATYDASQRVAKRYSTRKAALVAVAQMQARGDEEAYVVRLKRKPRPAPIDERVVIRKERETLGSWLLANLRTGVFMGPRTDADAVKLVSARDFVTLILAGAHVIESGVPCSAKAISPQEK